MSRAGKHFIASLRIPTYKQLKFYQFHDALTALVRHGFITQHTRDYKTRKERINLGRKAGIMLTKWEVMKEDSHAFKKLEIAE